jgi:hypothetical protein
MPNNISQVNQWGLTKEEECQLAEAVSIMVAMSDEAFESVIDPQSMNQNDESCR